MYCNHNKETYLGAGINYCPLNFLELERKDYRRTDHRWDLIACYFMQHALHLKSY